MSLSLPGWSPYYCLFLLYDCSMVISSLLSKFGPCRKRNIVSLSESGFKWTSKGKTHLAIHYTSGKVMHIFIVTCFFLLCVFVYHTGLEHLTIMLNGKPVCRVNLEHVERLCHDFIVRNIDSYMGE